MKHWSSTQASIALSSGEAEFAGVLRGAGQGLGFQSLLKDLGIEVPLRVWTDSSAAIGICSRQGLGKLRHLDIHTLWIQQAVRTGRVDLRKVLGEENPADLLTKHSLSRQRLEDLVNLFGCRYLGGRAASAPQVRKGEASRVTMASADIALDEVNEREEQTRPRMTLFTLRILRMRTNLFDLWKVVTIPRLANMGLSYQGGNGKDWPLRVRLCVILRFFYWMKRWAAAIKSFVVERNIGWGI